MNKKELAVIATTYSSHEVFYEILHKCGDKNAKSIFNEMLGMELIMYSLGYVWCLCDKQFEPINRLERTV